MINFKALLLSLVLSSFAWAQTPQGTPTPAATPSPSANPQPMSTSPAPMGTSPQPIGKPAATTPSAKDLAGKPDENPQDDHSMWEKAKGYIFDKGDDSFHGFFTLGYKPVYWYNDRLDAEYASSKFDSDVGGFSIVEFGLQTSKGWALKLALPDESDLRDSIDYLKFFLSNDDIFIGVETGGFKGQINYGADEYKFGTVGGNDPLYSAPISINFNSGYRKIIFGYNPGDDAGRWEAYYYSYNKPYLYNITGTPESFESLDPRSTYEGYFLGFALDTYNYILKKRPGKIDATYYILRLGLGYGQTRLSQGFADEVSLLTNQEFKRDMDSQIVLNETFEMGRLLGNLKKDGIGYALSFGFFLDFDFSIQNAVQKKENIKIETSNTIVSSNFDVFYGLVFKGSITW